MGKVIPREVNIRYVPNRRGGDHNVLEVCGREHGVRFVMAQDSETAKERDKYKMRSALQADTIATQAARIEALEKAAAEVVEANKFKPLMRAIDALASLIQGDE